jgi:hypothetical protein
MSDSVLVPAVLLALSMGGIVEALHCLADHLLASALIYAVGAAALAVVAGKVALDAI